MFYIGTAKANQNLPQFVVKKTAGSMDENVEAYGYLYSSNIQKGGLSRSTLIDDKESKYQKDSIFNEGFNSDQPEVEELKKKYGSFFRKKDLYGSNAYYEDNNQLGYADIVIEEEKPRIKISILDKKNGEITDFEPGIPKKLVSADFANVIDVQIFGNEMRVMASLQHFDKEDIVLFTVDMKAKKLTDVTELYKGDNENPIRSTQRMSTNSASSIVASRNSRSTQIMYTKSENPIASAKHFVFAVVTMEEQEVDEEDFISKEISRKYIDINMETGVKQEIGSAVLENKMIPATVDGNKLYAIKRVKGKIKVQVYDLDQKKNLQNYEIEWPEGLSNERFDSLQVSIQDGKLIMASALSAEIVDMNRSLKGLPQVLIADEKDGKLRWHGVVMPKDIIDFQEYSLSIDGFKVK